MKVVSTEALTKLIQLVKSAFIKIEDVEQTQEIDVEQTQEVTLANVATSGDYDDLSNKPTIPAAQVNSDWNATSGVAQILNKPTIPVVPTNVSAFTNDAGYITSSALNGYATESYVTTAIVNKQDTLVSGTNIKTINSTSVLGSGNFTLADQSLSNLDSTGQMIVDSANGTISNCILEIPQNIKLTLENNVLTLKAGSIITLTGSTYATATTTQDYTTTIPSYLKGKKVVIFPAANGGISGGCLGITSIQSGSSLPATGSVFFNTTDKLLYTKASGEWTVWNRTYPICLVDVDSEGNVSFAKDSNGNDMIFNGACFIGHHAVIYPNISVLEPDGFNANGSLKSIKYVKNNLSIIECNANIKNIYVSSLAAAGLRGYEEYEYISDITNPINYFLYYISSENRVYGYGNGTYSMYNRTNIITLTSTGRSITDFTIRQPVRTATTEMLDKKQDTLTFDTTPTSASTNPVTSGGVYTALSGKADKATTLAGYGITDGANTSLSNLNSTGQMIVDSANGTISNCILEIPQNIKLTLENNVLTLKSGSIVTLPGSTYTTVTTTQDNTLTISTNDTFVVFSRNNGLSIGNYLRLNKIGSGSSLPADGTIYTCFFNTTDKLIYLWYNNEWIEWNVGYPLCVVKIEDGNMSFAKDSNGNDMIFNGACFVGHHAVVYPNIKGLIANGFNADGTLKSTDTTLNSLQIRSLASSRTNATVCLALNTINAHRVYTIVDDVSEITTDNFNVWYVRNENQMYLVQNSQISILNETMLITYSTDSSNNVTDFTIRQPVRMATTEMLDKKQDTLTAGTGIDITNNVISADIATSVSSASTNSQSVGAKLFYDIVGDIETLLSQV